jgi:tRNA (Thr-GGU) A37 N-methylase
MMCAWLRWKGVILAIALGVLAEIVFDEVGPDDGSYDARHRRGRKDWPKVGIFAQRGRDRPNRIGASVCRL